MNVSVCVCMLLFAFTIHFFLYYCNRPAFFLSLLFWNIYLLFYHHLCETALWVLIFLPYSLFFRFFDRTFCRLEFDHKFKDSNAIINILLIFQLALRHSLRKYQTLILKIGQIFIVISPHTGHAINVQNARM